MVICKSILGGGQLETKNFTLVISLCFTLCSLSAIAQDALGEDAVGPAEDTNPEELIIFGGTGESDGITQKSMISTWDFVRMLLVLGAVIGAIYLLFFFLKRGARRKQPDNELIRLVDYQSLNGNRALHLVMVGENVYLVGSSENGVQLVSRIEDKLSIDSIRLELAQKGNQVKPNFSDFFSGMFKSGKNPNLNDTLSFMKKQRERLEEMRE